MSMSRGAYILAILGTDRTFGAILICTCISCCLLGVVINQALSYFNRFSGADRLYFRLLVGACLFACIVDTALDAVWSYNWTVTHYGDPSVVASAPFELGAIDMVSTSTYVLVQTFFAWRLYIISGKKWLWSTVVVVGALVQFGCISYMAPMALIHPDWTYLQKVFYPASYVWLAACIVSDFTVTVGMIYYLHLKARGIKASQSKFNEIIYRCIQSNFLGLVNQLLGLILFKQHHAGFWFVLQAFIQSKLISFSLIASLNSRRSVESTMDRSATPGPGMNAPEGRGRLPGNRSSIAGSISGLSIGHRMSIQVERETQIDIEKPEEAWKPTVRQSRIVKVLLPENDEFSSASERRRSSAAAASDIIMV